MPKPKFKLPVITYEEPEYPGGPSNPIPFIITSAEDPMPPVLLIEEARDTGELTVGDRGKPEPVFDYIGHQYISIIEIQKRLSAEDFDKFRKNMGMKSKAEAAKTGEVIFAKVEANVAAKTEELMKKIEDRKNTVVEAVRKAGA